MAVRGVGRHRYGLSNSLDDGIGGGMGGTDATVRVGFAGSQGHVDMEEDIVLPGCPGLSECDAFIQEAFGGTDIVRLASLAVGGCHPDGKAVEDARLALSQRAGCLDGDGKAVDVAVDPDMALERRQNPNRDRFDIRGYSTGPVGQGCIDRQLMMRKCRLPGQRRLRNAIAGLPDLSYRSGRTGQTESVCPALFRNLPEQYLHSFQGVEVIEVVVADDTRFVA